MGAAGQRGRAASPNERRRRTPSRNRGPMLAPNGRRTARGAACTPAHARTSRAPRPARAAHHTAPCAPRKRPPTMRTPCPRAPRRWYRGGHGVAASLDAPCRPSPHSPTRRWLSHPGVVAEPAPRSTVTIRRTRAALAAAAAPPRPLQRVDAPRGGAHRHERPKPRPLLRHESWPRCHHAVGLIYRGEVENSTNHASPRRKQRLFAAVTNRDRAVSDSTSRLKTRTTGRAGVLLRRCR